ncbi:cysteine desulfurase [Patescibacteria group bacterium AH-259-L07]|nr:cysteine desulfurase [Patescibacteria group bacterium AH-259-L07]
MKEVYLDYAATTPVDPRVVKTMTPYFQEYFGNPSNIHIFGQRARKALDTAREQVARLIHCSSQEIVFTSGGTESNNLVLKSIFYAMNKTPIHIITSSIEHHAILEPCKFLQKQGAEVTYVPVDKYGMVDPEEIKKAIQDNTVLISIMHANNEIGTIQPISDIAEIIKTEREKRKQNNNILVSESKNSDTIGRGSGKHSFPVGVTGANEAPHPANWVRDEVSDTRGRKSYGEHRSRALASDYVLPLYFHTDAVQTVGHIPVDVNNLGVDFLSLSAHKLYGPKGVGAVYIREGVDIVPLIHGSGQERGHRSSTENVSGIVGFGRACEIAEKEYKKEARQTEDLRDYFVNALRKNIKNISVNGHAQKRLPNNINITIEGIESEVLLIALDQVGIACSTGSACTPTSIDPSHVLLAIGLSKVEALSSIRFSLGRWSKKKHIDYTIHRLIPIVKRLRGT